MKTLLMFFVVSFLFASTATAQQWYAQEYNLDVDYAMALSGYTKVRPQDQVRYQVSPGLYYTPTFAYPQQWQQYLVQQRAQPHYCQQCRRFHY